LKLSAAYELAYVPEYLVGVRVRRESLSQRTDEMLAGFRQVRARIRELFPQVPAWIHRSGDAFRLVEIAESYAWDGRYQASASRLFEALRLDPRFVLQFLVHGLVRSARLRLRRPVDYRPGRKFSDYSSREAAGLDPFGIAPEGPALQELRKTRLKKIAEVDEALAALAK
jgi:hypothetical protein